MNLSDFLDRMRSFFLKGLVVPPVVNPVTRKAYPVTTRYGVKGPLWSLGYHTGEDHTCPVGSLALATTYGTVEYAGDGGARWGADYGTQVIVRTRDGKYDYAHNHLSALRVKAGDQVVPGQTVGITGASGHVTGPHDHFEARPAGGRFGSDIHPIRVKARRRRFRKAPGK